MPLSPSLPLALLLLASTHGSCCLGVVGEAGQGKQGAQAKKKTDPLRSFSYSKAGKSGKGRQW